MQAVPINYWAVLVCGIVSMVLGSLWFGPLFGKAWQRLMGWEHMDAAKREEMKKSMTKSYVLTFIAALIMAFVLAHSIVFGESYMKVTGLSAGLQAGFWSWLGFVAPVTLGVVLWEGKSWKLWTLSNAYQLIQLLVFGVILGLWK